MKDRYLFRGKRIDTGRWVKGGIAIRYFLKQAEPGISDFSSLIVCSATSKSYIFPDGDAVNESELVGQEGCLPLVTFEVIPETVGQFTGLLDKNGVRIFEGDIIRFETYNYDKNGDRQHVVKDFIMEYRVETDPSKNGGGMCSEFLLKDIPISDYEYTAIFRSCKIQVIGNTTDNPELLKEAAE